MKNQENQLGNPEKNMIAMGAAMAAGCRTCADKLYELALGMKIPEVEMKKAFQWGLNARTQAGGTMSAKMDELLVSCCAGEAPGRKIGGSSKRGNAERILLPVRIASFVAANSPPRRRGGNQTGRGGRHRGGRDPPLDFDRQNGP